MHLEPPQGRVASIKDFLKHYAMIVLSILTALGLEAAFEARHHHAEATEAIKAIEHELHGDLDETRRAIRENQEIMPRLQTLRTSLVAAIQAGRSADDIRATLIKPALDDVRGNLWTPVFVQAAWERAIANHSATWIDEQHLDRFSAAYSSAREVLPMLFTIFNAFSDSGRLVDVLDDAQLGRVDPV